MDYVAGCENSNFTATTGINRSITSNLLSYQKHTQYYTTLTAFFQKDLGKLAPKRY